MFATAAAAALGPVREERALLPGTEKRPADVFLPNWSGGRDTALDVTVVNPLRADFIEKEADTPGFALSQAYNRKMRQVGEACEREGIVFIPLPIETFGGWSEGAVTQIKRLGTALAGRSGRDQGEVISHLFQKPSVLLNRGNAALICNRVPEIFSVDLVGDV